MAFANLREFIAHLEKQGSLRRVSAPVSRDLEIAEITDRVSKSAGGRNLALLEMKLLLSMLYKNFEVERVGEAEDVREIFALAMSPAGLEVRLRRRSGALAKPYSPSSI